VNISDPIFGGAWTLIDTSDSDLNYHETPMPAPDHGHKNVGEARILADLTCAYIEKGYTDKDIGIIVPYKAQADCVRARLEKLGVTGDIVSTVDSYQGNERPVILFGFTRANRYGRIGFLREWRRLNVSITRVKHHLVLVGHVESLLRDTDDEEKPFKDTVSRLVPHVRKRGRIIPARELGRVLDGR